MTREAPRSLDGSGAFSSLEDLLALLALGSFPLVLTRLVAMWPGRAVRLSGAADRVARFSPGHYRRVSLSPLSAIADMVAPVVLITLATIFANGLMSVAMRTADRVTALANERIGIMRGPHGEVLDESSVAPMDRERLAQIRDQVPLLVRRAQHTRNAVMIIWIAIGLLVLSVAAIAIAATARSEAFAFTALALVLAGVAGFFAGVAMALGPVARSRHPLMDELRSTGVFG